MKLFYFGINRRIAIKESKTASIKMIVIMPLSSKLQILIMDPRKRCMVTLKKTSKFWLHHSITRTSVYTLKGNITSFILTHSSFLNFN